MFNWLRRRRLSSGAKRTLMLVAARSEEAILETHAANVLGLLHALEDEVDSERGLALYTEMMELEDAVAANVANRVLARLAGPEPGKRTRNVFSA
jgi:5-carboxymethyl-2-hydroxymuconate isomerase